MPNYPLIKPKGRVEIQWLDHHFSTEPVNSDLRVRCTVGYIVENTPETLVLSSTIEDSNTSEVEFNVIAKALIVSAHRLVKGQIFSLD